MNDTQRLVQMAAPFILVFDSGLGGLTVFREIVKARPDARLAYVADDAFFPYGDHDEAALKARVVPLMGELIASHQPDLVVIACNTASVQALAALREHYKVPFVGTVPAIKPACAQSKSKRVAVLGTKATVAREYTRALIREFAQGCDVELVGSAQLARMAEAEFAGTPVTDTELIAEIAPCFVDKDGKDMDGRRTDTVVLACTHFPLLLARLTQLAPWPVAWIDPAPAIARRVVDLLGAANGARRGDAAPIRFTSGKPPSPAVAQALAGFGLAIPATTRA